MELDDLFYAFCNVDKERTNLTEKKSIRIFSEFIKAKNKLNNLNINNTLVFFGSARILSFDEVEKKYANNKPHNIEHINEMAQSYEDARTLANKLALWSKKEFANNKDIKPYICTGGGGGIMQAANQGAHDANEESLGLNIELPFEQGANKFLSEKYVIDFYYFFLRKFWFAYMARAFIVFPGGFGTLDELFEILTLIQTQKIKKDEDIPIVLFGKHFFDDVFNLDTLHKYDLISEDDKHLFLTTSSIDEAYNHIINNVRV